MNLRLDVRAGEEIVVATMETLIVTNPCADRSRPQGARCYADIET